VALLAAWVGLLCVVVSAVVPFLPGSRDPTDELTHAKAYSLADRVLTVAIYLSPAAMALGIVVLRQMSTEPRPLPEPMRMQRVQAWVGIALGLVGAAILYIFVFFRGPTSVP
jgi:hypothetical protein